MKVSRIALGCLSFGSGEPWMLNEEDSRELIERAIDLGINFFDMGNSYSDGEAEEIVGGVLADYDRDWPVVATKVFFPQDPNNPNSSGLSRKAIEQELENSLDRLGMETIDLYNIHRWDNETPIEETLRTLDDTVRRGKVRYVGASSMWAHQFAEALHTSDLTGLERFITMENHYNLTYREEEREMVPLCEKEDVGMIPWNALARGYLTRPDDEQGSTKRGETDRWFDKRVKTYRKNGGVEINRRVEEMAEDKGVSMAQIALSWVLHQDVVDAPIVGTTSIEHLEEAVEALDISLSSSEMEYLEEPYEPREVVGLRPYAELDS